MSVYSKDGKPGKLSPAVLPVEDFWTIQTGVLKETWGFSDRHVADPVEYRVAIYYSSDLRLGVARGS